jgi:ABC-type sugar transport system permease subunit
MLTPITDMKWVGFKNYLEIFDDSTHIAAIWHTIVYVTSSVALTLPLAFFVSQLLYFSKTRGKNSIRVLLFATYVIPTSAIVVIWGFLYAPTYGPINQILETIGLPTPAWLSNPEIALYSLVIFNVWQMLGYYVILIVAGFTQIPSELFEAAKMDGANFWQQTRKIIFPLSAKTLFFVTLMTVINSIQVFDPIYLLTQGGPVESTITISFDIRRTAFSYGLAGEASALAFVLLMFIIVFGYGGRIVAKRVSHL